MKTHGPTNGTKPNERDGLFASTRWTMVLEAGDSAAASAQSLNALSELCQIFWRPLYLFLRSPPVIAGSRKKFRTSFLTIVLGLLSTVVTPQLSFAASGTWIADANGNWSDPGNWAGGSIADGVGATADFTLVNLTGNRNIALFAPRTLGILNLGDTNHTHTYTISGGPALTFDNGGTNAQLNQTAGSAGDIISSPLELKSSLDITNASTSTLFLSGISST